MNLQQRIDLSERLKEYILSDNNAWQEARQKAFHQNSWFTPEFIDLTIRALATNYLQKDLLTQWTGRYAIPAENKKPLNVGIVMAGNIPLVGFHDFLSTFISGHRQTIKTSSKDDTLIRHLVQQMVQWDETVLQYVSFSDILKGCDAYIATGSNNSARYFEYYFSKYPHIIRRNRTSVAILNGNETTATLEKLADDVYQYFGLGCRNVTKLYVPEQYDFVPLLETFKKYNYLAEHNKYKNNYDYALSLLILNREYYMTNGSVILHQNKSVFSPISRLHFEYYTNEPEIAQQLENNEDIQCIVSNTHIPFGKAQQPGLTDYADGVDTMKFLLDL